MEGVGRKSYEVCCSGAESKDKHPKDLGLQKAACSRAEMPLRGSARCEVPAEPVLHTPRPGDFQSTCVVRRAQQIEGKRRKVNVSLNFERFYDAAAFIPLYCYFSSDICEVAS